MDLKGVKVGDIVMKVSDKYYPNSGTKRSKK